MWCVVFKICDLWYVAVREEDGGPSPSELVQLVDQCDLSSSRNTTPSVSPSPQLSAAAAGSSGTPQALRRRFLADVTGAAAAAASTTPPQSASFTPITARQSASAAPLSASSALNTVSASPCDSVNVSWTDVHSIIRTSVHHRLSLIHIWRCRRSYACRSRWSPYH